MISIFASRSRKPQHGDAAELRLEWFQFRERPPAFATTVEVGGSLAGGNVLAECSGVRACVRSRFTQSDVVVLVDSGLGLGRIPIGIGSCESATGRERCVRGRFV